jgi:two-component system, LytTR family, sensor histidine kinase AlgZ
VHPILGSAKWLAAYLGAWLVVCVLVAAVFAQLGFTWLEALALLLPLFLLYAFVCLSAWYVSRATPLRTSGLARILGSSALAAAIAGGLWLGAARAWVVVLGATAAFGPAAGRYDQQMPFLFAIGVLLFLLALAVHYVLIAFESAREAERRQLELELLTRDAELRALRAQLDPHFLYNSLNSISALTSTDAAGARRMCLLLGEFLRDTLRMSAHQRIPLGDELAQAERFLKIEQVRYGARLRIDRRIDEGAVACLVPPLVLQPLVENAVSHGIAHLVDGGAIRLDISRQNGHLAIVIENPRDNDAPQSRRDGMGLKNVRGRIEAMFGRDARMDARASVDAFRVELHFPCAADE